ncbi:MAG: hypothetical protein LH631_00425 [Alkalinema sp. CAN_BIN05]|nr:hypothetical protein [Alkalinema sp. CAN_BIN05]
MYSLLDRFHGGLWGMTIASTFASSPKNNNGIILRISDVMLGHISYGDVVTCLEASTDKPVSVISAEWSFYATLSLSIASLPKPTPQDYASWTQGENVLNQEILDWVGRCIKHRESLAATRDSLQLLSLNSVEQSIALAIYGSQSTPGNWILAFNRILQVSPQPELTAPLLGCLLGVQFGQQGIPSSLRVKYQAEGKICLEKARGLVKLWSGAQDETLVVSPRRSYLN